MCVWGGGGGLPGLLTVKFTIKKTLVLDNHKRLKQNKKVVHEAHEDFQLLGFIKKKCFIISWKQ